MISVSAMHVGAWQCMSHHVWTQPCTARLHASTTRQLPGQVRHKAKRALANVFVCVAEDAACSSRSSTIPCRPMRKEDLGSVKRLHKFAKHNGKPVFGSDVSGVEEMLDHAAAGSSDTLGIVAHDGTELTDILGCVTAQMEAMQPNSSHAGGHASEAAGSRPCTSGSQGHMALLTLVVRADQRKLGIGKALLHALRQHASELGLTCIATDVAASNQPAIRFFEASGFKKSSGSGTKMVELVMRLLQHT